jgi:ABC-type transport system substrate-binding protein
MLKNKFLSKTELVKFTLAAHWQTLHPGLQHTLSGDLVLSNQFDSLVGMDEKGILVPLGAKSWTVNDDFTVFEFKIDTSKRFSDGSYLTALDYKKAWESSAELVAKSSNNSLLDVLYKLKGFSEFDKSKSISGLEIRGADTLILHFTSPFRMALDHLVGNRFASHKNGPNETFIGTGKYIISEVDKNKVLLSPNQFNSNPPKSSATIEYLEADKIFQKLTDGEVDGIPYIAGNLVDENLLKEDSISVVPGQDALHLSLGLNLLSGRFFNKICYRQAIQQLMFDFFKENQDQSAGRLFTLDQQIYLPGQSGRLSDNELNDTLKSMNPCIEDFKKANQLHPLKLVAHASGKRVVDIIKKSGIKLTNDSGVIPHKDYLEILYKSSDADIVVSAFSIANGDPDGIYHRLGKNGAILSPMNFNESVGDLLETGRKIVDIAKLDIHYKEVSKSTLINVPIVHLGFSKAVALIRKDRLQFNTLTLRRNEGHLEVFELK